MRALLYATFFIIQLVSPLAQADSNVTTATGQVIQFLGQSGQIKLTPANSTDFIQIRWNKIEEVTPQGVVVQSVNNFASQVFTWSQPESVVVNGYNATSVVLASQLSVGLGSQVTSTTIFNISTYIFNMEAMVRNGNQTLSVPENSVKFTVHIDSWPFLNYSNVLTFGAALLHAGGESSSVGGITFKNSQENSIDFGPGTMDMANTAVVDGYNENVTMRTYSVDPVTSGVQWTFPAFNVSLDYDPTLTLTGTSSSSNGAEKSLFSRTLFLLLSTAVLIASLI